MNIVILSGGSGNDALIHGLVKFGNKENDITVITNAYDNGKSTGICRAITNTLGVSDIRKNHYRMYKYLNEDSIDENIEHFYCDRPNLTLFNEEFEVIEYLTKWGFNDLIPFAKNFFSRGMTTNFEFKDFSIANIIYAEMYSEIGYTETNRYFCEEVLNIPNFVKLNSFENSFISAKTANHNIIVDEGEIVEYRNSSDKIIDIVYAGNDIHFDLNQSAIWSMEKADLIIISTGTFWSSIYPTLFYGDFYKAFNDSKAKKIWVMNTEQDKDSWGVGSNDFIDIVESKGLNLSDVIILENQDANISLRESNQSHNVVYAKMGNDHGKNSYDLYFDALKSIVNEL